MEEKIKVIYCPANSAPVEKVISNTLKAMQELVGGNIEAHGATTGTALICNEEGRILGMPENMSAPFAGLCGDVFLCGTDGEDFASIADDEVSFWLGMCRRRWLGS